MEEIRESKLLKLDGIDYNILYFLRKILMLGVEEKSILFNESDLFYKYKSYDKDSIISLINSYSSDIDPGIFSLLLDKNILNQYLNILIMQGVIVCENNLTGEDTYRYVSSDLQGSSYTRNFVEISGRHPDKILLISDTHIGSVFEDFDLIKRVFDYALEKYGISISLHLGDVFDGVRLDKGKYLNYTLEDEEILDILYGQIDSFVSNFPDYMKVIAIEGNHDLNIIELLRRYNFLYYGLNERILNMLKPNFQLHRSREFGHNINLGDFNIHINHEMQFNIFFPYVKTSEINNIDEIKLPFTSHNSGNVDLYLSGHFHFDLHHSLDDFNGITKRMYEVIPSLSKVGYDGCVAKIISFSYDNDGNTKGYSIIPLYTIDGKEVFEGEASYYESNRERLLKSYRK